MIGKVVVVAFAAAFAALGTLLYVWTEGGDLIGAVFCGGGGGFIGAYLGDWIVSFVEKRFGPTGR